MKVVQKKWALRPERPLFLISFDNYLISFDFFDGGKREGEFQVSSFRFQWVSSFRWFQDHPSNLCTMVWSPRCIARRTSEEE